MKIKIIALLVVISFTFFSAKSQSNLKSKSETENWLLSKFNKYSLPFSITTTLPNNPYATPIKTIINKIYFNEHYLVIIETFECTNETRPESERKIITKIPIADINEISAYQSSLSFDTKKETIIEKRGAETETVKKYASFGFKYDSETDLIERVKKAFINLKRFYKMPKNDEAF